MIVTQLNPISEDVKAYGAEMWLRIISTGKIENDREPLASFLLPLALSIPNQDAAKLASFSFAPVHEALARSRFPYDRWLQLDAVLPRVPWYKSWDKCERLRRGFLLCFDNYNWPLQEFFSAIPDEQLFFAVIDTADKIDSGLRFLKRAISDIDQGLVQPTSQQMHILDRFRRQILRR